MPRHKHCHFCTTVKAEIVKESQAVLSEVIPSEVEGSPVCAQRLEMEMLRLRFAPLSMTGKKGNDPARADCSTTSLHLRGVPWVATTTR